MTDQAAEEEEALPPGVRVHEALVAGHRSEGTSCSVCAVLFRSR